MSLVDTLVIAAGLGLLGLLLLAGRFPRGRFDWPWDRSRTGRWFVSLSMLLFTLAVSFYAFSQIAWPDAATNFVVVGLAVLVVLGAISLLSPRAATR